MSDSVCILGGGRSFVRIKEFADKFDDVLLVNYDENFIANSVLKDPEVVEILSQKNCILFCNNSKLGFNQLAFEHFNVKKLVVNRLLADWDLWRQHKEGQTHDYMYYEENMPKVKKDLPYLYKWRGPGPEPNHGPNLVNWPTMFYNSNSGQLMYSEKRPDEVTKDVDGHPDLGIHRVYPMPEGAEEYLIEPTNDRMEKNCGLYFTSLYSIVEMKKKHLYFAGIDFYDTIGDGVAWKQTSSSDRLRMEGAHMKILLNRYLPKYFPEVTFEVYTKASIQSEKENVIIHQKDIE
jgi:hypothetical protein